MSKSISQFVDCVLFCSSQYTSENGSARNLIGPPNCLNKYGDNALAWCPAKYNQMEFVEVSFKREVYCEKLRFYENLNGGCVVRVETLKKGKYICLWKRDNPEVKRHYHVYEIIFEPKTSFRVNQFKVHLNCSTLRYYTQIDAIELIGSFSNHLLSDSQLGTQIGELLYSQEFADIEVFIKHGYHTKTMKLHRSILYSRTARLLAHIKAKKGSLDDFLDYDEFYLVIKFIYSGCFDFAAYELFIEQRRKQLNDWKLIPNKFVRFSVRFGIEDLSEIIIEHMVDKYLSIQTFGAILVDAAACTNELTLEQVENVCLKFIMENLHEAVSSGQFRLFSKKTLLKIITLCIFSS